MIYFTFHCLSQRLPVGLQTDILYIVHALVGFGAQAGIKVSDLSLGSLTLWIQSFSCLLPLMEPVLSCVPPLIRSKSHISHYNPDNRITMVDLPQPTSPQLIGPIQEDERLNFYELELI